MSEASCIVKQMELGDQQAAERLLPLVYDELRKLAAAKLAQERPGQTLQATALVHEAYLRLMSSNGQAEHVRFGPDGSEAGTQRPDETLSTRAADAAPNGGPVFQSRGHFFAAAAEAMRRILVENARRKASLKRGGGQHRISLPDIASDATADASELLALDEALGRLAAADPQAAQIVKLRYFAGLTMDQAADALGVSPRTAYYAWQYARSWLRADLRGGESSG
jgi:RNA polymerase sigma factor (sigma-70 family)